MSASIDRSSEFDQTARHEHGGRGVCGTCGFDHGERVRDEIVAQMRESVRHWFNRAEQLTAELNAARETIDLQQQRIAGFERLSQQLAEHIDRFEGRTTAKVDFLGIETIAA